MLEKSHHFGTTPEICEKKIASFVFQCIGVKPKVVLAEIYEGRQMLTKWRAGTSTWRIRIAFHTTEEAKEARGLLVHHLHSSFGLTWSICSVYHTDILICTDGYSFPMGTWTSTDEF